MKYMKLNIQLLFALVFLLGIFSCSDENERSGKKEIREGLPTTVSLKLTSATPMVVETKSLDDGTTFGEIKSLAILVYKTDGTLDKLTYVSGVNAKNWNGTFNATTGTRRVYVLANSPLSESGIKSEYASEKELLNNNLITTNSEIPVGNEQMLGFVKTDDSFGNNFTVSVSDEIEITESVDGSTPVATLYSRLYPPYSKITFTVKNEVKTDMSEKVELKITNVYVRNRPNAYSLLPNPKITTSDVKSDKVLLNLDDQNEAYKFYMYENPQGTKHADNNDPQKKSPFEYLPSNDGNIDESYDNWDVKWATKTPCTYIEVEGTYAIWKSNTQYGAGKIHYRFFLGNNIVNDFNIVRNTHYKVELAFTGIAGYNELQYEWRVNAQLNDIVIIPEGILEIDGSPDFYFPFYIINSTGQIPNIDTDFDDSNMKLRYQDEWGGWQEASDLGKFVPKSGVLNCEVHSIDFGILGAAGHNDINQSENIYTHEDTGIKYTSHGGDNDPYPDNITYRDDVGKGKIYRKRKFTIQGSKDKNLTVKEYPLLCLYENTEINGNKSKNTVYAQRIDRINENGGKLLNLTQAKKACNESYSGNATMYKYLPTTSDLIKMIQYEKYFVPGSGSSYWTTKGLYYWDKGDLVKSDESEGYVRCVYKHYESTKFE